MQATVLAEKRREGNDPSGLHNNFHDIESFLEAVLVPTPVSISAELVPSVLSRGLGLASESYSLGQQGSNDRRSGRPRSSVSNGVQGNTNTNNNNNVIGAGAQKVRFDLINAMNTSNKDEAKNNLVTTSQLLNQSNVQNNNEDDPNAKSTPGGREGKRTRRRDNHSAAGGTSRKKKTKDKVGSPATNVFPIPTVPSPGVPGGAGPHVPAQYVFGVPHMGLPPQLTPHHMQQIQMGQIGQMGLGTVPPTYMFSPSSFQLPDGRIFGFYPGMEPVLMSEKVETDTDHTVKRSRLVWTDDLHKKFLDAVERCGGIEHALPKAIMNDMKVIGLTRENVSSHLQKYRIRVKEEAEKKAEEVGRET